MLAHNSEQPPFFNYRVLQRAKALASAEKQVRKAEGEGWVGDRETSLQAHSCASETRLLEKPGCVPQLMLGV